MQGIRVYRGGCWDSDPQDARVTDRVRVSPSNRLGNLGFRLAMTV